MVGMVSGTAVDFIDLTASSPQDPPESLPDDISERVAGSTRERSALDLSASAVSTPIVISDDETLRIPNGTNASDDVPKKKRRKKDQKRKNGAGASGTSTPAGEPHDLFFFDENPSAPQGPEELEDEDRQKVNSSLTLPEHVTVNDGNIPPNVILASTTLIDSDGDDFINYADADTVVSTVVSPAVVRCELITMYRHS